MAVIDVFAWTPLFLSDSVNINIKVLNVEDTLELTDTVRTNILLQSVTDYLYLNDAIELNKTVALVVQDALVLSQDGRRTPIVVSVSDHLAMYQSAIAVQHWPDVRHTLTLVDVATCYLAKGVYDSLTLSQAVTVTKSVAVHAESTLTMINLATVYKPDQFWTSFDVVVVNP